MSTKAQMQEIMDRDGFTIADLKKDLQAAKEHILILSASNQELSTEVAKLKRVIVQKCLDELKEVE